MCNINERQIVFLKMDGKEDKREDKKNGIDKNVRNVRWNLSNRCLWFI